MSSLLLVFIGLAGSVVMAEKNAYSFKVPEKTKILLENYCYDCHDSDVAKGGVKLDDLGALNEGERLDLLNMALEHVYSGEMPPKKAVQPKDKEREELAAWLWRELKIFNASKLEEKIRNYKYANYLDHEKLFSGDIKVRASTPARRWRINELIYHERINDIFELKGRARRHEFSGIVKPFNLPTTPGVAYYDTEVVAGGQLLTLLSNAKWVVDKQLRAALLETGEFKYPPTYFEAKEKGHRTFRARFPDEVWNPGRTAEPFASIIKTKYAPTKEQWTAAIHHQFKVALQREARPDELQRYLGMIMKTLKKSDKTGALKNIMVAVMMETEFIYRTELGDGKLDEYDRSKLTPREASYAIAYALTDRIPDATLVAAAESGALYRRNDYEREVRRMLADSTIDKPRILRFFQDYFGYKGVYNVFKDEERFVGNYNPQRVVSTKYVWRVPGKVHAEADALVNWVLKKDEKVLETLLTTDRFFVHHNGDNEEMQLLADRATKQAAEDRKLYKELIRIDKSQYKAYMKKTGRIARDGRLLRRFWINLDEWKLRFGPDGTKGEQTVKVTAPKMRDVAQHTTKVWNIDHRLWNYQPVQPMRVKNRTGILTHPAWLISNSLNAATDPIHRGKWVREQLLGGFIRDVPITVDAKVPENVHKTLRERFEVTKAKSCWQCHEKMNPLGMVFEEYDDFGRFRREEALEYLENIIEYKTVREKGEHGVFKNYKVPVYKSKAVDSSGYLEGTGDLALDGPVQNVHDLMTRLAKSDRVRQVFIRNVFRYFMGRNETFIDSQSLINAENAYLESGGSFKELIVSILTSDSFIYRKSS